MFFRLSAIIVIVAVLVTVIVFLRNGGDLSAPDSGIEMAEPLAQSEDDQQGQVHEEARGTDQSSSPRETFEEDAISDTGLTRGGDALDWHAISDVDALYVELVDRFEAGDVHAGYQLFELAEHCMHSPMVMEDLENQLAEANDPETIQGLQETRDKYQAIEGPCRESELWNANVAMQAQSRWLWRSAEAGHAEAMYDVVFGRSTPVPPPEDMDIESTDERLAYRQDYARQLREACDHRALYSMGAHFSRQSPVTEGLHVGDHTDADEAIAWQLEGFAHRYTAGRLQGESDPARQSRNPDHPLTPAQESRAMDLAGELLQDCE
ncbi:hypothetical protein J2T60_001238 [Natronospira proteinivora]|uniref:Sel1 repeat family protein n=1 Tax=Natronospira proteinivora TaxID=1807133 RepID=A0ABT1G7J0_9GAMM|nr:hypothetical protein [Natronospira proteinivora]MCP1727273.1 hypothetical protein [Natronospira proteinivora]